MESMFDNCQSLTSLDVSDWDVSNVTTMYDMFYKCYSLTTLDVSDWDIGNVTDMYAMFCSCESLTELDVSNWDTSNVTGMKKIFADCHNLSALDLTNWDTSNITDFTWLFTHCYNLTSIGNISNWDTSNVDCFDSMFCECNKLSELDLSGWDTSNVTDMGWLFCRCTSLNKLNISNWDTSSVTYIDGIFGESAINNILMNNSDYNSVNKIISVLPTRSTDSMGTLNVAGVDDISQVNIGAAQAKYWNVLDHISIHYDSSYFTQGGMDVNGELFDSTNPIYNLSVMTDFIDIEHFKEVYATTNRAEQGMTVCTIYEYDSDKEYIGYVSHETNPQVTTIYNKSTDVKYIIIGAFNVAYKQITPSDVDFDIVFR
jgi:surface protein